jgi:hypothetical protein
MKRLVLLALFGLGVLGLSFCPRAAAADDKEKKGEVVELDGLKAAVPGTWKEEKPSNNMRFLQYKLPKVEGDKDDAELVVFRGFGGSAEENIKRWKATFTPPEGKELDDVAKVTDIKIGGLKAVYLDVSGTYMFKAAPFDPKAKVEARADNRMLAVHFEGKNDQYHIKLVGPAKTVASYKTGFDEWLKALK